MSTGVSSEVVDSYEVFYCEAKEKLKRNLNALRKEPIEEKKRIVSLGRKGVRMFDDLFLPEEESLKQENANGQKERDELPDVVSEHALPFISRQDRNTGTVYYLMDDALYYGSSAKGVAKEVYAFENIYGIRGHSVNKICFLSAIDTEELRPNFECHIGKIDAKNVKEAGFGRGYSHFFSKRLSKDIRSLENTFEIEFPIVSYALDKHISEEDWKKAAETIFPNTKKNEVYIVDHVENYSINILLDCTYGCSFNKLRLFPSNSKKNYNRPDRVKVVCMSPLPIRDDDYLLEHLFDNAHEGYRALWKEIFDRCYITTSDTNSDNIMDYLTIARWRCKKSLVVMANYLISFSTFVQQCGSLEKLFAQAELKAEFRGIDAEKDLYYLLGDMDFCHKVAETLGTFYMNKTECGDVGVNTDLHVDYTVFENSKDMDESIATLIRIQDDYMMEKSQNMEEVLGALFYNQDVFYEKQVLASNPITQDFNRLRMGYTFESLLKTIDDAYKRNFLKQDKSDMLSLHRWVDQRIDEASIVPQYVLDEKSKHWLRVFRHGENEDPLLGHLARFVLLVYLEWNEHVKLGWIEREEFQNLLIKAYREIGNEKEQIVESTNINIYIGIDENKQEALVFTNSHYKEEEDTDKPHNVLQYMIDMCILSEEANDRITIHKRTNFFIQPGITTMEKQYENKIKEMIKSEAKQSPKHYKSI